MKNEIKVPPKHELEHEVPTVLHHEEENRTLLAQWVDNAHDNPGQFWGVVGTIVFVVVALGFLGSGFNFRGANSDSAWTRLETAKSAADRVEIAKEFPKTEAERWALLQAATEYFSQGFSNLPGNIDAARPTLKKALDLFQKVADEAPAGSSQARFASLGVARTLEARGELKKAFTQYEKVAKTKGWEKTAEGQQAARLAALVNRPEVEAFYKDLYEYKNVEITLPEGKVGEVKLPFTNPVSSGLGGLPGVKAPVTGLPKSFLPDLSNLPPPPPSPTTGEMKPAPSEKMPEVVIPLEGAKEDAPKPAPVPASAPDAPKAENTGLPDDVFSPATPAPDAPKAENNGLPDDVFSPATPAPAPAPAGSPETKPDAPK